MHLLPQYLLEKNTQSIVAGQAAPAVYRCPTSTNKMEAGQSHVADYGLSGGVTVDNIGATWQDLAMSCIARPSQTYLSTDTFWVGASGNRPSRSFVSVRVATTCFSQPWTVEMRHAGRAAVAYVDGHADKIKDFPVGVDSGRRWVNGVHIDQAPWGYPAP